MSKLIKLLCTQGEHLTSNKSGSEYFQIGVKKLRVSDHISLLGFNDLDILIPNNSRKQYIVDLNGALYIYNTFTELKLDLLAWCRLFTAYDKIKFIGNSAELVKSHRTISTLTAEIKDLNKKINSTNKDNISIQQFSLDQFSNGQQLQIKQFLKQQKLIK